MSTRCNVILKDSLRNEITTMYRHDDGYPEVTGHQLKQFCKSAAFDKETILQKMSKSISKYTKRCHYEHDGDFEDIHADLDWVYVIDLNKHTLTAYQVKPFCYNPELSSIIENYVDKKELIK